MASCGRNPQNPRGIPRRRTSDSAQEKNAMSRRQFLFYATASDLCPLLSLLETRKKLQYTLMGLFETDTPQTYLSYADIPDFGRPNHPAAIVNPAYLVASQGTEIRSETVPQKAGGVCFHVSQKLNDNTIAFWAGGLYGSDVLLYGQAGTISNSLVSKDLYGLVVRLFRKQFTTVQEFLVGPEALELGNAGVRLTLAASSPSKFDLKL
jgi:hypothetical protein